jgi:hypothetical protein
LTNPRRRMGDASRGLRAVMPGDQIFCELLLK